MKHRDIEYRIHQTTNPKSWMWTVHMDEKRTKTGESSSRGNAIFNAVRAIDKALAALSKTDDDPLNSDAMGWLSGELGRGSITHEIHDGKMIPKPAK
jgi:hypothetical protein